MQYEHLTEEFIYTFHDTYNRMTESKASTEEVHDIFVNVFQVDEIYEYFEPKQLLWLKVKQMEKFLYMQGIPFMPKNELNLIDQSFESIKMMVKFPHHYSRFERILN